MVRTLGARARPRTRVVRGHVIHEVLVFRGAGPPTAIRFPKVRPEPRRREAHLRPEEIGHFLRAAERLGEQGVERRHVTSLSRPAMRSIFGKKESKGVDGVDGRGHSPLIGSEDTTSQAERGASPEE